MSGIPEQHLADDSFRALLEAAPDAMVIVDRDGRIVLVNAQFERLFGYDRREILGRGVETLVPDRFRAAHLEHRHRYGGDPHRRPLSAGLTLFGRRRDGTEFPAEISLSPLTTGEGSWVTAAIRDVTERHRALEMARLYEHLRERDERFRELAESIHEIFWLAAADFSRFLYISPAYAQIWGRDPEALAQRPREWQEAVLPEDRARVREWLRRLSAEAAEVEVRIQQPGGAVRWVAARGWPVRDAAGAVHRVAGVAEDVTHRRSLEEQFRQAQKLEAVGRLAGGVAHDFNNLLTAINGYTELALRQLEEGSLLRTPLEEVQRAGQRAADLTRQLLAFSRRQLLRPKVLDLNALIADMQRMLERLIGEDVKLQVSVQPSLGRVFTDPGQLEQVVMNLVLNSRDAMAGGGAIALETADVELLPEAARELDLTAGRYVALRVVDTGHGMDAETRARVFEPFFTTKEAGRGTGLGLSTVYGIVRQSDGAVHCQSEPGVGTSFTVYLPLVAAPADAAHAGAADETPGGRERVLVVEDDAAVREITRALLEPAGYRVQAVADGEQALALLEGGPEPPDLLLTDVVMPGLTGPQLAERLVAIYPGLRVLFTSGYAAEALGTGTNLPPGVDLLPKPFTRAHLLRRVRAALDR